MNKPLKPDEPTDGPALEARRMAAVRRYDILDTPPDGSFDHITALAASLFSTPISIISIVDHDRIWFKSRHGLDVPQIGRDPGLCASAIMQDSPYLLGDARLDPRSLGNPLVAGEFGLRFYLAAPLRTSDGFNLGTLNVIDREPRTVTAQQIERLEQLAAVVVDQLELRLSARRAVADLSEVVARKDQALKRTQLLAKEIDHRVMNSLQYVSSLLSLQGRGIEDTHAAAQLDIAAGRIAAVARVHRHFYLDDEVESTCALAYLQRLCADLGGLLGGIEVSVRGAPTPIATTSIMPLGLIVNELVTNSAKHGAAHVAVSLLADDGGYQVSVVDDGPGLAAGFDPAQSTGLGMKVVLGLVRQLGGQLEAGGHGEGRGAAFTFRFPAPSAS